MLHCLSKEKEWPSGKLMLMLDVVLSCNLPGLMSNMVNVMCLCGRVFSREHCSCRQLKMNS